MSELKSTFDKFVEPVLSAKADAWQGEWATFAKFQLMCGVVQSRTFHLEANNWLTGSTSQGALLGMNRGAEAYPSYAAPTSNFAETCT